MIHKISDWVVNSSVNYKAWMGDDFQERKQRTKINKFNFGLWIINENLSRNIYNNVRKITQR